MAEVPFRPIRQLSEYKEKGPLLAGKIFYGGENKEGLCFGSGFLGDRAGLLQSFHYA